MTYPANSDSVAHDQLRAFFERWQRLEEDKSAISDDLKELFAEAKGNGFDTKVLRKVFRDKVGDASDRLEFEAIYELYASALGMGTAPREDDGDEPRVRPARSARENIEEFPAASADASIPRSRPSGDGVEGAPTRNEERGNRDPAQSDASTQTTEPAMHSDPSGVAADLGGEGVPDRALPVEPIQSDDPTEPASGVANDPAGRPELHPAALNALKLRPWCLHASELPKCAGVGKKHCFACQKAHADAEGETA